MTFYVSIRTSDGDTSRSFTVEAESFEEAISEAKRKVSVGSGCISVSRTPLVKAWRDGEVSYKKADKIRDQLVRPKSKKDYVRLKQSKYTGMMRELALSSKLNQEYMYLKDKHLTQSSEERLSERAKIDAEMKVKK